MSKCVDLTKAISKKEMEWLFKAVSRDPHRPILSVCRIEEFGGMRYAVTTDTRRLHALNLGKSEGVFNLDIRRILFEMRYHHKDLYLVDENTICKQDEDMLKAPPIPVAGRSELSGAYPPWPRVVLDTKGMSPFTGEVAVNGKHFQDAAMLSEVGRVVLNLSNPNRPMTIQEKPGDCWACRWFAVVMPMAIG